MSDTEKLEVVNIPLRRRGGVATHALVDAVVTHAENQQNKGPRNGRPFRGIEQLRSGHWGARTRIGSKRFWIGTYETAQGAASAAAVWRAKHMPYAVEDASLITVTGNGPLHERMHCKRGHSLRSGEGDWSWCSQRTGRFRRCLLCRRLLNRIRISALREGKE